MSEPALATSSSAAAPARSAAPTIATLARPRVASVQPASAPINTPPAAPAQDEPVSAAANPTTSPASRVKDDPPVNKEIKLALLIGFCAVVVVGLLVAEHFSAAHTQSQDTTLGTSAQGVSVRSTEVVDGSTYNPFNETGAPAAMNSGGPSALAGLQAPTIPVATIETVPSNNGQAQMGQAQMPEQFDPAFASPRTTTVAPAELPDLNPPAFTEVPGATPGVPTFNGTPTPAQTLAHDPANDGKHPVKRSETLRAIARKYYGGDELAQALADYNRSKLTRDGKVREGVTLRIPPKEVLLAGGAEPRTLTDATTPQDTFLPGGPATGDRPAPRTPEASRTTRPETPPPASGATSYTVAKGDTPMHIARKTLGSAKRWREIMKANPGLNENALRVGQKIKIPAKTAGR